MIDDVNILRARSPMDDHLRSFALDAPERAEKLLGDPGLFDSWAKSQVFNTEGLTFPLAVEVRATREVVDLSTDSLTVGLLWDDGTAFEAGPQECQAGEAMTFQVPARKGNRLEVWTSGFDVFGSARIITPAQAKADEAARAAQNDANRPSAAANPLEELGDAAMWVAIGLGGLAVVALVVVLSKKGPV